MSFQLPMEKRNFFLMSFNFCFVWACCFAFFAVTTPTIKLYCRAASGTSLIETLLLIPAVGLLIASIIIRLIKVDGQNNGRKIYLFFPVLILGFLGTAIADCFLLSSVSLFYQCFLFGFILTSVFYSFLLFIGFILGLKRSLILSKRKDGSALSAGECSTIKTETVSAENGYANDFDIVSEEGAVSKTGTEGGNRAESEIEENPVAQVKSDLPNSVSSASEMDISGLKSLLPQVEYPQIEGLFRRFHWTMFIALLAWVIPFGQTMGLEITLKILASLVLLITTLSATQETLQSFIIAMFYRNIIHWLDSQSSSLQKKSALKKFEASETESNNEKTKIENRDLTTAEQHFLVKIANSPDTVRVLKTLIDNSKEAKTKIGSFKVAVKMLIFLYKMKKMIFKHKV